MAAALALASVPIYSGEPWPVVQDSHKVYSFQDIDSAGFDLPLTDSNGHQVYLLRCHSGLYEADRGFDYSGLLECRLVSLYSKETASTLLTETSKQGTDWENRGRFLAAHLRKGCANYPDWGQRRDFRLRGMDIAIALLDITFGASPTDANKVRSYSVEVTVRSDPTSTTPLAKAPTTPEPSWFYHPEERCGQ